MTTVGAPANRRVGVERVHEIRAAAGTSDRNRRGRPWSVPRRTGAGATPAGTSAAADRATRATNAASGHASGSAPRSSRTYVCTPLPSRRSDSAFRTIRVRATWSRLQRFQRFHWFHRCRRRLELCGEHDREEQPEERFVGRDLEPGGNGRGRERPDEVRGDPERERMIGADQMSLGSSQTEQDADEEQQQRPQPDHAELVQRLEVLVIGLVHEPSGVLVDLLHLRARGAGEYRCRCPAGSTPPSRCCRPIRRGGR